jgi:hypothetical protein
MVSLPPMSVTISSSLKKKIPPNSTLRESRCVLEGGEKLKDRFVENVCAMFRRNGLASKYEHPGIYCIRLNE